MHSGEYYMRNMDQCILLCHSGFMYVCRIYTGGENAEFIFAIGPSFAAYFAKLDAKTLEVLQKIDLGE